MHDTGLKVSSIRLLVTILGHFGGEVAPRWSYFTQINGRRISKKTKSQLKPYRSTHHSQQHLSSSPSYRKYNTIFYKRLREQNIYYLTRNSVQAKYVQQTWSHQPKVCERTEQMSDQCETEHFGWTTRASFRKDHSTDAAVNEFILSLHPELHDLQPV